jgi:hypothetical protein
MRSVRNLKTPMRKIMRNMDIGIASSGTIITFLNFSLQVMKYDNIEDANIINDNREVYRYTFSSTI